MIKMPWKKKTRQQQQQQQQQQKRQRQSFFSDQVIRDYSVTSCPCELYFPEPSLMLDEFGAIQDVCLSGDELTLLWSKHCMLHLCVIPDVPPELPFSLEGTGQESEICLSVVLNRSKSGDFSYQFREKFWHEYSHKVNERWRRFVLKFDHDDEERFYQFEKKLEGILKEVNKAEKIKGNKLYLLVAVQTKLEKRKSSTSLNKHSRLSLHDLREIEPNSETGSEAEPPNEPDTSTLTENSLESISSSSEDENGKSVNRYSLTPPFDPAPYNPDGDFEFDQKESIKSASNDTGVLKSINHLCDSLHIHPNELPQTLSSILRSAAYNSDEIEESFLGNTNTKQKQDFGSHLQPGPSLQKFRWGQNFESDIPERLNSEFIPTEDLYIPMGCATESEQTVEQKERRTSMADQSLQNLKLHKAQEVAQLLQTAINNGDAMHAQEYAKQLASQNVTVTVDVKLKTESPAEKEKEFNLKVNIEDKETSGGTITLKVKASDTIRDLKNRMLMKHMFPVEVQYWIIGKRIPQDHETLEKCKIKNHGFTAFLYLISANAVGINKDEFMWRQNMLLNPGPDFGMAQAHLTPAPTPNQTPNRSSSSTTPGSSKAKMEPRILEENLNLPGKNEKHTPEKLQGQVRGQVKEQVQKLVKIEPNSNRVRQAGAEIAETLQEIAPQIGAAFQAYPETPYGESKQRIPVMHPEENEEPQQGWACPACTYINQPTRPGCELCSHARPADYEIPPDYVITDEEKKRLEMEALIERRTREAQEHERLIQQQEQQQNFANLQETDALDLIPNSQEFTCPICFDDISESDGVVLRECLHMFCKGCLRDAVQYNEDPVLKCPFLDDDYACDGILQDREVKALVSPEGFAKYLARSLATAESQAQNSFHCKTADCPGWCIYEDHVNFFVCQVCGKENCLTCKAIHQGQNCKQYQDDLQVRAVKDKAANQTQIMIKKMLDDGDAMNCPQCQVIVMKKEGCDWIQCSICKTEICWVTKGPRWGPMGNGDVSGGCMCRVNGEMCHPDCNNCH